MAFSRNHTHVSDFQDDVHAANLVIKRPALVYIDQSSLLNKYIR